MIARPHRLPLNSLTPFSGTRHQHQAFTLIQAPNSLNHYRLGLIISKKVDPLATHRNRLKRQIAHIAIPLCAALPNADWLIIVRPPAAKLKTQALTQALNHLFIQATTKST